MANTPRPITLDALKALLKIEYEKFVKKGDLNVQEYHIFGISPKDVWKAQNEGKPLMIEVDFDDGENITFTQFVATNSDSNGKIIRADVIVNSKIYTLTGIIMKESWLLKVNDALNLLEKYCKSTYPLEISKAIDNGRPMRIECDFYDGRNIVFTSFYKTQNDPIEVRSDVIIGTKVYSVKCPIEGDLEDWELSVIDVANNMTEVYIDVPSAEGIESYYQALGENNSLVITTDPDEALDVYVEIITTKQDGSIDEFFIYSMIDNVKMYYNIDITDPNHPTCSLSATALVTYNYLNGIISYIVGDTNAKNAVAYSLSVWDSATLGDISEIKIENLSTYSCDFITKDTNEVTTSPIEDVPYRYGILYGHEEADIKLKGDTRESGKYALDISNTANDEPVVVSGVADPELDTDAANKGFVVKAIANVNAGGGTGTGVQGPQGVPGQNGQDGKSAYEYAVEGGYTGTEAEFAAKMAKDLITLTQAEYDALEAPDPNVYYFIKGDS